MTRRTVQSCWKTELEGEPARAIEAAKAIAREARHEAVPQLLTTLRTTMNHDVRNAVAMALSDLRAPGLVEEIGALLEDIRTLGNRGTLLYALL
jgi:hypothetical protein